MNRLRPAWALVAGSALLLITDAALLGAAAWNRRGGPQVMIQLTERELRIPEFREEESSALGLSLTLGDESPPAVIRAAWRKRYQLPRPEHAWLDKARLEELGFHAALDPSDQAAASAYDAEIARRAFIVLEFEGASWERWLASQEDRISELRRKAETGEGDRRELQDAEALLALDRAMRSRLFPVDAGLNLESLRRRYPDRAHYLIVRGRVEISLSPTREGAPQLRTFVTVLPDRVSVPLEIRPKLVPFLPHEDRGETLARKQKESEATWPSPTPPRYCVTLAYGRRLEPWIVSLSSETQPTDQTRPATLR